MKSVDFWKPAVVALALALAAPAMTTVFAPAAAEPAAAALEPLSISTASGRHAFEVEVMRTEEGRERGLMFRRSIPADHGMLFDFDGERVIDMWMKNTFIPLDMIFIGRAGKVVAVLENTEPMSERILSSRVPALRVLEVNAGTAARIGLEIGDAVTAPPITR
ncbi:DUF192 domain-containing protein [Methylocella sp.]|uniref:DUF192 domain-containing protein n=1 Tax=Methylocella sp. TaxID=1978226 RepID=UPI003783240D